MGGSEEEEKEEGGGSSFFGPRRWEMASFFEPRMWKMGPIFEEVPPFSSFGAGRSKNLPPSSKKSPIFEEVTPPLSSVRSSDRSSGPEIGDGFVLRA